ncbi:MAG TPA: endonuclease/exonuclease/phosphatase family protein [Chitinophagales bacterium]|nr:endonuclease/exonuclease/phosphatase family protein [Chitinophagales bacterium]
MPFYHPLKLITDLPERKRIIDNILALRLELKKQIPPKTDGQTLLIATWNLREFSKRTRIDEAYYYLAEIIGSFDLVALEEVGNDLGSLMRLMYLLGNDWNYLITDSTEGAQGGGERLAFVFENRKVRFNHIAGEIVLPDDTLVEGKFQFARTPFSVAMQAGWFNFMLCSVHIYYGEVRKNTPSRRADEIGAIAKFLHKRAIKENRNYILIGDFNITAPDDDMMKALKDGGFDVPVALQQFASGQKRTTFYDQIAFDFQEKGYKYFSEKDFFNAGAFNFYDVVLKEDDFATYRKFMDADKIEGKNDEDLKKYFKTWRTYEMSDHLPLWAELQIDFSEQYLIKLTTQP